MADTPDICAEPECAAACGRTAGALDALDEPVEDTAAQSVKLAGRRGRPADMGFIRAFIIELLDLPTEERARRIARLVDVLGDVQ